jgi:hypothetical protein
MPDVVGCLVELDVDVESLVAALGRVHAELLAAVLFRWAATRGWQA